MKGYWLFVAISVLLVASCLLTHHVVLWIGLFVWMIKLYTLKHFPLLKICLIFIVLSSIVIIYQSKRNTHLNEKMKQFNVMLMADTIKINGDLLTAMGYINQEKVKINILLMSQEEQTYWFEQTNNHLLSVSAELVPYKSASNPNQLNISVYMREQHNSHFQVNIEKYKILSKQFNGLANLQKILKNNLPNRLYQLSCSLLLSKVPDMSEMELFQSLGILYLIVASGIHIRLFLNYIKYILLRLSITHQTTIICLNGIAVVYWLCCQHSLSIQKYVFLQLLTAKITKLDKIAWVMMAYIFINPYIIFTPWFQFSFSLSILSILSNYSKKFMLLVTMPLLSYHFFDIPLMSFILAPIVLFLLKKGLLKYIWSITIMCWIPFIFPVIISIEKILSIVFTFLEWLSNQSWLKWTTGRLPIWQYVVMIGCLFIWYKYHEQKSKKSYIALCLLCICLIPLPQNRVVFIDVGQGDSLLIQSGYQVALVDTGGDVIFKEKESWKTRQIKPLAKRTLIPMLKSLGIHHIHTVFITHEHDDHKGALKDLQLNMSIGQVVSNKDITMQKQFCIGQAMMTIMSPNNLSYDENDNSLVIYMEFEKKKWLLTGDAGQKIEHYLMAQYPKLQVDVLKVGHHGSKTATCKEFVEFLKPEVSIISVGENNRFNHPHQEVLDNLTRSIIYRTDIHGAIEYINGKWFIFKNILQKR